MFWSPEKILSYNRFLNVVIGIRGVGKTYGTLKRGLKRIVKAYKKGKAHLPEFVYMRRYLSELETVHTLLNPLFNKEKFLKDYEYKLLKQDWYIRKKKKKEDDEEAEWRVMGHYMSASTGYKLKGTSYEFVDFLIYDEFLYEKDSRSKELKNEVNVFLNIIETIFRNRDNGRVILLGNATTFDSSYREAFKLMTPYNSKFWTSKEKSIVVELAENEEYKEAKKASPVGQLAKGLNYEAYAIDNQFNDSFTYIKRKKGNYRRLCVFSYNQRKYGIFVKRGSKELVIDTVKSKDQEQILFSFKTEYMDERTKSILTRQNPYFKLLRQYFNKNKIFYQNMDVKYKIYPLFLKNF